MNKVREKAIADRERAADFFQEVGFRSQCAIIKCQNLPLNEQLALRDAVDQSLEIEWAILDSFDNMPGIATDAGQLIADNVAHWLELAYPRT